jgi:diguanylate cyclase (GGDEF)-like protein
MPKRQLDLRKIFAPSDTIAFVVIVMGLFIALFIDEMAVRLIGVCIAILGGVALFMMISPRLLDLNVNKRNVSQQTNLGQTTKQDNKGVRTVFDPEEFRKEFGAETEGDAATALSFIDEHQQPLFEDTEYKPPIPVVVPASEMGTKPTVKPADVISTEYLGDEMSGVRIVRKKPSEKKAETPLLRDTRPLRTKSPEPEPEPERPSVEDERSEMRRRIEERKAAMQAAPPARSVARPKMTEVEQQLSEDVTIRRKEDNQKSTTESTIQSPIEEIENTESHEVPHEVSHEVSHSVSHEVPLPEAVQEEDANKESHKRRQLNFTINDFIDEETVATDEPRKEFDHLLNRVLQVIRSMTSARTAAFFWVNHERNQLVVEARITDATDAFTEERKLSIGDDVVSQIATYRRPEILTAISPAAELDLLPYYSRRAGTVSFIGVPVIFGGAVIGVLCADSQEVDAYDSITVGFFGHFTKLISGLVQSYTGKFDLLQSARTLQAVNAFRNEIRGSSITMPIVLNALIDSAIQAMDISTIGVCTYNSLGAQWEVGAARSVEQAYDHLVGRQVSLEESEVGQCILSGRTIHSAPSYTAVRAIAGEPHMDGGQFIAVPLKSASHSYGALYVENPAASLSQQDIGILETLGEYAGTVIEQLRYNEMLRASALLHFGSGILNRNGFMLRLKEECTRSTDFDSPFTLCLLRIDRSDVVERALGGSESKERILLHVLQIVQQQIRDYDVVGHIDDDTLAIGLVARDAQRTQLWMERLRSEIASSIITVDDKRFTVTVSVGIAQLDPSDGHERLLDNTYAVLARSVKQGNKVTVYA